MPMSRRSHIHARHSHNLFTVMLRFTSNSDHFFFFLFFCLFLFLFSASAATPSGSFLLSLKSYSAIIFIISIQDSYSFQIALKMLTRSGTRRCWWCRHGRPGDQRPKVQVRGMGLWCLLRRELAGKIGLTVLTFTKVAGISATRLI